MIDNTKVQLMQKMFYEAVNEAKPENLFEKIYENYFLNRFFRKVFVTGFGKASAAMASALEKNLSKDFCKEFYGKIIVPDGYSVECNKIDILLGSHPIPDKRSLLASQKILDETKNLTSDDLLVVLISGGGSSLFCLPHDGISLKQKQDINNQLLKSGASIKEINCVRKHLSKVKGGNLAKIAYPAECISLAISDVPGDLPSVIASGPTVSDETSCKNALEVVDKYHIKISNLIRSNLSSYKFETPFKDDKMLKSSSYHLLATPKKSLDAAAKLAKKSGFEPIILGDKLEGYSRELATWMSSKVIEFGKGKALISGGETTVIVRGNGIGGRNVEFLNALCLEGNFFALAADTDGVDGADNVAGAFITPDILSKSEKLGINPRKFLDNNDSHTFFKLIGNQIITGPTFTNVNDFRVILT